jgi:hypothetical protein
VSGLKVINQDFTRPIMRIFDVVNPNIPYGESLPSSISYFSLIVIAEAMAAGDRNYQSVI